MSIYSSRATIGDPDWEYSRPGIVGSYQPGNAHYWPTDTNSTIETADVPAWCVPGHETEDQNDIYRGQWLRLEINAVEQATVLIDADAARSLRDDLDAWLTLPKITAVQP